MMLLTIILSLLSYLGLYCGLMLGIISPEEVKPLKKYLKATTWVMSTILFLSLLITINEVIPIVTAVIVFGWLFFMKKQPVSTSILVISIPFFIIVSKANPIVGIALFLTGFPLGTLYLTKYVKKDELTKPKMTLLKLFTKETKMFWVSLLLFTILVWIFQY